jgi:serine/threonine protein kinase
LEIDVVVINRNGVYLLEVKHWNGPIKADSVHWRHSSGKLRPSPIPIIEYKARRLHGILGSEGWSNVSTVGLVVLSKDIGALEIDDPNAHKVFGLHESLIKALTGRDYVHSSKCRTLSDKEVDDLTDTILKTHVTDAEQLVCGYRVLSKRVRDMYTELVAQDLEFPKRQVRIKQYDVPAIKSVEELEESVRRFKREMDALVQAGPHLNLITPHRFQRHESSDERYYIVLEWTGAKTLADRIAAAPIEMDEQLEILSDVATALAHCHAHGVYHRNLSPASVYLIPTGQAKVGDFDFAKVPSISQTLSSTAKHLTTGRHLAPEQTVFAPDVDQRADIFALGATWYDMLFRPAPDEILDRGRIAEAPLSKDGKDFLRMLVAERRAGRPQSMREVQEWLALLK